MKKSVLSVIAFVLLLSVASPMLSAQAAAAPANPVAAGVVKQVGSIRNITGADLSLATDQGTELAVKVQPSARILRLEPGQTDLKSATPIQLSDLQPGDRVLVRGKLSGDGVTVDASAVVIMKQQDIAQKKQQELIDWQRRGVGGLVKQVDSQTGSITLSVNNKNVVINTTPKTICKRYAPNSVKWVDATTAKIDDIHPGDQLRAKGNKSEDGSQLTAEEIVAGTFRNIAGLITSTDSAQGSMTVQDLATKKPITVAITADSQMKILPAQVAQALASRVRAVSSPTAAASADAAHPHGGEGGRGDLNQMLSRLPAASSSDLHKGEAVMIVSTQGSPAQPPVVVTLLGGVEPILTAAPSGKGAESFLTPWSLASAPAGDQ